MNQNFTLYVKASYFSDRDTWVPSTCGYCYTCNDFFPNETISCYYWRFDIQNTITNSSALYAVSILIIFVVLSWMILLFHTIQNYGMDHAGVVAYVQNYIRMRKLWTKYIEQYQEKIDFILEKGKIAESMLLALQNSTHRLRSETSIEIKAQTNLYLTKAVKFPSKPLVDAVIITSEEFNQILTTASKQIDYVFKNVV